MNFDYDYARSMATQLAQYDVQAPLARLDRNEAKYRGQLDAINKLDSALRTFRTAVRDVQGVGASSMLVNRASLSQEGVASATVGASAVPGNYQFVVEQLASHHQVALTGLNADDLGSTGALTLSVNGEAFTVDLAAAADADGKLSLAGLAAAINNAADNSGVNATLVRSGDEVSLVLSSENSGQANQISLSASHADLQTAIAGMRELSAAEDAKVRLGGAGGLELTSASNTFDNLIDGVSLTFNRVHAAGEAPLSVGIGQDTDATKGKVNTFVAAVNTLLSAFDSLTASGGENSQRGPLAGDSSIRSIESMLNRSLRSEFNGVQLMDFGISADRNGMLKVDTARLEKAIAADPEAFDRLFSGETSLLSRLQSSLDPYTNATSGVMKNRKESLNIALSRSDDQMESIQRQYDRNYSRYLTQFTSMMQITQAMQQTQGMFE